MLADLPPTPSGALAKQIGRRAVDRAIRTGELPLVRRGVVAGVQCEQNHAFRVRVQQARVRGLAVAAQGTAIELHRLERLGRPSATVRLLKPSGGAWRDREVSVGVAQLPPGHVTAVNGVPATSVARTVVDHARRATHLSGVVIADSALRAGCSRSDLEQVLADCREWPGAPHARAAVALWPEPRVIGEADGPGKYKDILDLHAEKLRQERLERAGWIVVRWTWDDIWTNAVGTANRIRAALSRG